MTVELFGVPVASRHRRSKLGDAQIGLPRQNPALAASWLRPRIAACSSLGSVGKLMASGCTVLSTVPGLGPCRVVRQRRAPSLSSPQTAVPALSPRRLRQWLWSDLACGNRSWKNSAPVKRASSNSPANSREIVSLTTFSQAWSTSGSRVILLPPSFRKFPRRLSRNQMRNLRFAANEALHAFLQYAIGFCDSFMLTQMF